ncbi:MAG: TonB-dependent receptor [Tannerellaceae bacterium]|nr:TonB-dependent receptor [Tannerellaceae bacterium]
MTILHLHAANASVENSATINLSLKNVTIEQALDRIELDTDYTFLFTDRTVDVTRLVDVEINTKDILDVLKVLFDGTNVQYSIVDKQVILSTKASAAVIPNQANRITGVVVDERGEPIIGANIVEKETINGTITDSDGAFTLQVANEAILVVTYIGYIRQEIPVGNKSSIRIILVEDSQALDEIVVVGYGTQKKANLTGAVEAVKGDDIVKRPVMSTTLALQGLASGVTVTSNSGQPGNEGETIRVRGIGTLNDNNPLVLVDGVASSVNAVNPNDIESVSILKDAASSSIYGSRAANGVILITTKRAKTNEFAINFSGTMGFQTPVDLPKFLGAVEYLELYDIAASNDSRLADGTPGGVTYGTDYINNYRNNMASDPYRYPNTNWADVTYNTPAFQQQYNLSFSGGTEKLKAFVSLNYQDQEGMFPDTHLKRYTLRVNTDYQFSDKFSAGIDVSGRHSTVEAPYNYAFNMGEVRRAPAIYTPYNEFGQIVYPTLAYNVYAVSQKKYAGYDDNWYQEGLVSLKASYKPLESLWVDFAYAPKFNWDTSKQFEKAIDHYDVDGNFVTKRPLIQKLTMTKGYSLNHDIKLLVNFNKSFADHNVTALGGFQQITNFWENTKAYREGSEFQYDQINSFPVTNQRGEGEANEWALQSYFGRINYDYAGKYLFEGNIRYDGSSRFSKGHKWGLFPSFSAGWRFSQEGFMERVEWLSNAKLRGSWGQLGNQEGLGSNYPFSMDINISQPMIFNRVVSNGYAATDYAMNDITWETTEMTDIGIDLGFLNNKLEVVFDYYIKTTDNILMSMDIPSVMGYGNQPKQNAGKVQNKGWDLSLIYNDRKGDFSYRAAATLSDVKNEILDMKGIVSNFNSVLTNREGYPINSLWGLQADGLFPSFDAASSYEITQYGRLQGGDVKYLDQPTIDTNGDGVPDTGDGLINGDDYQVIGNTIPRYTYSLDLALQYKGFDLGLFFQGVGKRDSYLRGDLAWAFNNAGNIQEWQRDGMWKEGETNSAYPRLFIASTNNIQASTYWKQNAAYLRLKNLQFGYSIPAKALRNSFVKGARFYVSCQNLFTLHHMVDGYDPEQKDDNARDTMPLVSTYSLGFNLNF